MNDGRKHTQMMVITFHLLDVIEKEGCIWTVKHHLLPYWLLKLQLLPVATQMNAVICVC